MRALGWKPETAFDDALDATIAWYRANEWWWRPLKDQGATQRQGLPPAGPVPSADARVEPAAPVSGSAPGEAEGGTGS